MHFTVTALYLDIIRGVDALRTNNFSLGDKLKDSRPSLSHSYCALKGAMNRGRIVPLPFMSGTGPHNVNRSDLTKMSSSAWHLFLFAVVLIFPTFFFFMYICSP